MGIFKTIASRIARIIQGYDEIFPAEAVTPLELFALVKQAQTYVENKTGHKPTTLLYSPTLKKVIPPIADVLASELGIIVRKEHRIPNDQLMLVLDEADVVLVSPNEDAFISFLDRADSTVGVVIGDVEPYGDVTSLDSEDMVDEYSGGWENEYSGGMGY